jgi:hypothetical protein
MSAEQTVTASHGRTLARILAGLFGAVAILSNVAFLDLGLHRTRRRFLLPTSGRSATVLIGFMMVVLAIRPTDVVALRVAWAAAQNGDRRADGRITIAQELCRRADPADRPDAPRARAGCCISAGRTSLLSLAIIAGSRHRLRLGQRG